MFKNMIIPSRAMTNTERQRKFRKNNPGYYSRLRAKRLPALAKPIPTSTSSPIVSQPSKPTPPSAESTQSLSPEFTLATMAA